MIDTGDDCTPEEQTLNADADNDADPGGMLCEWCNQYFVKDIETVNEIDNAPGLFHWLCYTCLLNTDRRFARQHYNGGAVLDEHNRPVPCRREGDAAFCDGCWCAGDGDAHPYCACSEYKILRANWVVAYGREWLSWCGAWRYGPFPRDYRQRCVEAHEAWKRSTYG